jgi:hypothetical protein
MCADRLIVARVSCRVRALESVHLPQALLRLLTSRSRQLTARILPSVPPRSLYTCSPTGTIKEIASRPYYFDNNAPHNSTVQ